MKHIILCLILILSTLNPAAGFARGYSLTDYTSYIEKYLHLLSKGNRDEKKLALSNLPHLLKNQKYRKNPKTFNPILDLLKDKDPSIREAAAASLKKIGEITEDCCKETQIVPFLIQALRDRHAGVRREAVKALGFYDDTRAVEPLIHMLQKDQDLWVRLEAAYSLGQLNTKKAVSVLLNSLKDKNPDWIDKIFQQECLIAFRKIGYRDTRSIKLLIKNINDVYLKAEIIKTLGQFRSMAAKDVLFKATQDNTAIIRKLALQAIDRLPLIRTSGMPGDQHPKSEFFIKFLKDPSPDVRVTSAEFLGKTGDKRAVGPLIEALNDNDRNAKSQAILSLGRYKDIRILTALVPFLGSPTGYLAGKSFLTVAKKTAEGTVFVYRKKSMRHTAKTLKEIPIVLKDNKPSFHLYTIDELIQKYPKPGEKRIRGELKFLRKISKPLSHREAIIHPVALDTLIHALTNLDTKVKIGALEVIKAFEDNKIEPKLIELLDDRSPQLRRQAMSTLYYFATLKSLSAIIELLNDKNAIVRTKAAKILGILKNKRAVQPLLKILDDNEAGVRKAALGSLQNFDDPKISDENIRMLKDESPSVREAALRNIKHKPDKRAVESVIPLLADSKTNTLAAEVLGLIGDKRAIDPLITALNDGYRGKGQLPNRQLMITAANVLSSFDEDRIMPHLIKKIGEEPPFLTPTIQIYKGSITKSPFLAPVMRVFQRCEDSKGMKILKGYLHDTDKELRKGAMFLFGMYQEEKAIKQLERSLNDPDPEIMSYTKEILDRIRSKSLKKIKESVINQPVRISQKGLRAVNPYTLSSPLPISRDRDGKAMKGLSPRFFSKQQGVVRPRYSYQQQEIARKESLDKTLENEKNIKKYLSILNQGNKNEKKSALSKLPEFMGIPEYKKDPAVVEPILNALIDKDHSIREAAATALNKIGENTRGFIKNTDIVSSLIMAFCDEYSGVRRNAARTLTRFKDKSAVPSLIERVYDENSEVRCDAAYSLGELKAKEAIPSLLNLFKDNTEWNRKSLVRKECLVAMRKMGYRPSDSVPLLIDHFNDNILKAEIVRALSQSYPPDAVETKDVLLKAINDPDDNVRRLAIEAIAELSRVSAKRTGKNDYHNIDFYIKYLKDPSAPVRSASIRVLSKTKDTRAVEPIIQVLHDRDKDVQREAIIALGKFRDERALGELVPFFGAHSKKLNQFAVESFSNVARKTCDQRVYVFRKNGTRYVAKRRNDVPKEFGKIECIVHQHAVDTLIHALLHDSTDVKIGVLNEIWRFEDDRVEPMLLKLLDDPSTKVRRLSLNQLHHFVTKKAVSRLVEALSDKDSQMRVKAAGLLGILKSKQTVNPLLESLNDSHVDVRRAAISALGNIQDKSAIGPLMERLSDPDDKIRETALYTLPMFEGLSILNINLRMLKDDSPDVRCAAIKNIKKQPDKRAVDTLILLLEDSDTGILAAEALGVIGGPKAVDPLIKALNGDYGRNFAAERDKAFKLSAAKSLGKLGGKTAVKALVSIVKSNAQKTYLRVAAANTLGGIGNKRATIPLINILMNNQSEMWLRAASASALGNIGDKRAVESLMNAMNEPLAPIRNAAIDALEKMGRLPSDDLTLGDRAQATETY